MKEVAMFIAFILLLLGGVAALALASDDDEWQQTEDPNCSLHTQYTNHVFAASEVTRTRYCEVAA